MSLSDRDDGGFQPMALSSLEQFDEEQSSKTPASDPDFDRFKRLFEKSGLETKESCEFKAMVGARKEEETAFFNPLIKEKQGAGHTRKTDKIPDKKKMHSSSGKDALDVPAQTLEEKGYQKGFERGLEQGWQEGQKQGLEDGFEKGRIDGAKKGEQQGREKGYQDGFEQGVEAGEAKGRNEVQEQAVQTLQSLENALNTADQTLVLLVEKYEQNILSLIQKIARKAVMAHLEMEDDIVRHLILDALKTLVQPEDVVLSICPEDYAYIEMVKDEFFEQVGSLTRVSVKSDAAINRGGCKIDTLTASVCVDIESRLDAIFEAIKTAGVK